MFHLIRVVAEFFNTRSARNMLSAVCVSAAVFMLSPIAAIAGTDETAQETAATDRDYERLFVLANTEFTLFHEVGHVLIWELNLPVFGREEDAADNIALMGLMTLDEDGPETGDNRVVEKLQAVADGWELEWRLVQEDELEHAYWDLHSLEIQRYYNIACLVYGADPENRGQIVKDTGLPLDRAEWCHEEYALAKNAMNWLLLRMSSLPELAFRNESGKVHVVYGPNTFVNREKVDRWLRQSGIAERLARFLTDRFDLPRDITMSFESCSFPNASWDVEKATIQFCYSLIERFLYLAGEIERERLQAAANPDQDDRLGRGWRSVARGGDRSFGKAPAGH